MDLPSSILIDTNILIQLEDYKEVAEPYAYLTRICGEYGIQICAHQSSFDDVQRDKDSARRDISLSKLRKYPLIKKTPIPTNIKEGMFGPITSPNDDVDTDLLVSVKFEIVNMLVTEDKGLLTRARNHGFSDQVLNVKDAVSFLRKLLGSVTVNYVHVQDKLCNEFNPDDIFFVSLKSDYPAFEKWFKGCMSKKRSCWLIRQAAGIGGLVIYKDELRSNAGDLKELDELQIPGDKVLKLCLFKIDENARGEKFGEQLLKKAMDYAYRNNYDTLYLTVFPKHKTLIDLIVTCGFQRAKDKNGESVYFKHSKVIEPFPTKIPLEFHRLFWPCILTSGINVYCVPIQPEFHRRLFPDSSKNYDSAPPAQLSLFEIPEPKTPGNAIRKVYVSNATINTIPSGSPVLFYRSKSSVITSIGVVESYQEAKSIAELKALVGRRSVYTDEELTARLESKDGAKVLNFYYSKDLENGIPLKVLQDLKVLKGAPQSIMQMSEISFKNFRDKCLTPTDRSLFYE